MRTCRICNRSSEHETFIGREMMFGTREEFEYFRCSDCGCLQISQIPDDLGKYYPSNYYAYRPRNNPHSHVDSFIERIRVRRCETALFGCRNIFDLMTELLVKPPAALSARPNDVSSVADVLRISQVRTLNINVLDVGCGSRSEWLEALEKIGFRNLFGLDPLIPGDQRYGHIRIAKRELANDDGLYDLITFHHSLEHIPNQFETLTQIASHLTKNGVCVIRIPTVSSRTWEHYQTNWVEMDPPRHLYLHSVASIKLLAERTNLELLEFQCDSTDFEFYGSETYVRNIHLMHENSPWLNSRSTLFSKEEREGFRRAARTAVERGNGGRAAFYFRKRRLI